MFQRFYKMECARPKQVRLITQALKFGKAKSMVENVMSGQLAAYFTRCAHCILLSEQKISQACIGR